MRIEIACRPAYAIAYAHLAVGEQLLLERDALVAMDPAFKVSAALGSGGVVKAGMRKLLGKESFFMGRYEALADNACLMIAPKAPGDIEQVEITDSSPLLVEAGCLLAAGPGVDVDVKFAGLTNIALHEGATMLRLHGNGHALIASYGGLQQVTLQPGQKLIVDTGHLVAWSQSCTLRTGVLGNAVTTELIGEGVVAQVTGPGVLHLQTRAEHALRGWLFPESEDPPRK